MHCLEQLWEVTLPPVAPEHTRQGGPNTHRAPREEDPGDTVFVNSGGEIHIESRGAAAPGLWDPHNNLRSICPSNEHLLSTYVCRDWACGDKKTAMVLALTKFVVTFQTRKLKHDGSVTTEKADPSGTEWQKLAGHLQAHRAQPPHFIGEKAEPREVK